MKMYSPLIVFALLLSSGAAWSQSVTQADDAVLQSQIVRDDKGFSSCGVRAVVLVASPQFIESYDLSVVVRAGLPTGALKAGKSRTTTKDAVAGRYDGNTVMPPPINFWIAKEKSGASVTPLKIIPSETPGFVLAMGNLARTLEVITAMIEGDRINFAVRYKNQKTDTVVAFASQMKEVEVPLLLNCLQDVAGRILEKNE